MQVSEVSKCLQFQPLKVLRNKMQTTIVQWQQLPAIHPSKEMICQLIGASSL